VGICALAAFAQGTYTFVVNNKNAKLETVDRNGKVFVEVNTFAQALGARVVYDKAKRAYTITSGSVTAAVTSPTQSTTQLAGGQGEIGKPYTLGKTSPLNFTLRSAEFTVTRQTLRDIYAPKADEKLLVLRFSLQNPQKSDLNVSYSALQFTAVDGKDRNVVFDSYWAREGQTEELSLALKPAQRIDVVAVTPLPADAKIPKLIVSRVSGEPVVRYDLSNKIKPLPAPFADPKDASGSTALAVVTAQAGTYYPMTELDVKLEGAAWSTEQMDGKTPEEGKRFLIATLVVKNALVNRDANISYSRFGLELTDAEGSTQKFNGYIIKPSRDEPLSQDLKPGAEIKFRVYFELPKDLGGKTLSVFETTGPSRAYVFDVSGVK
jgi:hypothetical protein